MGLPISGPVSATDINIELGFGGTSSMSLNDAPVRGLFGRPTGEISYDHGHGKSSAPPPPPVRPPPPPVEPPPPKAGLINTLYLNILGRNADSGGLSQWTATWHQIARDSMVINGSTPDAAFTQATIQVGTALGNTPLPHLGGATERSVYETTGLYSGGRIATTSVQQGIIATFAGIASGRVNQTA